MRVLDRPVPTFTPSDNELMSWPVTFHLLLESESLVERWDEPGISWDDPLVLWDQPTLPGAMIDSACDLAGVDIEHGPGDSNQLFPSGSMAATLVDSTGKYTRYRPDGSLQTWQIGKRCGLLAHDGSEYWWMFYGRVTSWSDLSDGTVELEAFNLPHELTSIGKFTPGAAGQKPGPRISAIKDLAVVVDVVTRLDAGTVALTAQETERTPWEEMQTVGSFSDGGLLFADVDDGLVYLSRSWRDGRSDQSDAWLLSDNDCDADAVVWDARLVTSDDELATTVRLVNVAGLAAQKSLAVNPYSVSQWLTHDDPGQWTTQGEGDALAQYQLDARSVVLVDIDELTLYVHDPGQLYLFDIATDTRLGDRMFFRHSYVTPSGDGNFTIGAIVNLIRHSINAHEWVMTLGAWTFLLPVATSAYAGKPGNYLDAAGDPAQSPQSFGELSTLAAIPLIWKSGEFVRTGDGTEAYHDLAGWHTGRAPVPSADRWGSGRWHRSTWASPRWDRDSWDFAAWTPPSAGETTFDLMMWDGGVWQ